MGFAACAERRRRFLGLCGPIPAGRAGTPPSPDALAANDLYESFNRQALKRNAKADQYFVIPAQLGG
jgi:ABC-type transporter lipoprotein component MlaA